MHSLGKLSFFTILIILITYSAKGQNQHPSGEQWYNWTDDDARHYIYEFGNPRQYEEPIIVLHGGWGAEHSYLIKPFSLLADNYRFVLYDQRGSLRSPAPDSTLTVNRMVADLEELRKELDLSEMVLAAHSMGNHLAFAYLHKHPERVKGLIAIAAPLPKMSSSMMPDMNFVKKVWPEADSTEIAGMVQSFFQDVDKRAKKELSDEGLLPESQKGTFINQMDFSELDNDKQRTQAWRISFTTVNTCDASNWRKMQGGKAFYNQQVATTLFSNGSYPKATQNFWPTLKAYEGPVRIIVGSCDLGKTGPAIWPHVSDNMPDAETTIIQDAGHNIWMDRPAAFRDEVDKAIQTIKKSN